MKTALKLYLFQTIIFINGEDWYSATLSRHDDVSEKYKKLNQHEHHHMPPDCFRGSYNDPWRFLRPHAMRNPCDRGSLEELTTPTTEVITKTQDTTVPHYEQNIQQTLNTISNIMYKPNVPISSDEHTVIKNDIDNMNITNNIVTEIKHTARMGKKLNRAQFHHKKQKFLDVLQIVQFENVLCKTSSGLEGTCLHEYECKSLTGVGMGTCADGYGTCCVFLVACNSRSTIDMGWFTNPDYPLPSNERLSCSVTLEKSNEDVVQIRLDFGIFELLPPSDGVCLDDQFVISGQNMNNVIPILCGINTGQHVYIEVSESDGPINLSIQTAEPNVRVFSIKITQLTSADDTVAPSGCLQFHMEPSGYLESFNYRDTSVISIQRTSSYLNNLNYAMCIERNPDTCSISYINVDDMQIVNYDNDGLPIITPGQAGVEVYNCPSDWLLIAATRLCGERLNDGSVVQDFSKNAPVIDDTAGPIIVWFRSDESYVGKGFKLYYEQHTCTKSNDYDTSSRTQSQTN